MTNGAVCNWMEIVNKRGLHARAAAKFVRLAESFESSVVVAKEDVEVSGCSIMGLMMLAASKGARLRVCTTGPDALKAMEDLTSLVKRGFDEDE